MDLLEFLKKYKVVLIFGDQDIPDDKVEAIFEFNGKEFMNSYNMYTINQIFKDIITNINATDETLE